MFVVKYGQLSTWQHCLRPEYNAGLQHASKIGLGGSETVKVTEFLHYWPPGHFTVFWLRGS
jgi:hypothetical protein